MPRRKLYGALFAVRGSVKTEASRCTAVCQSARADQTLSQILRVRARARLPHVRAYRRRSNIVAFLRPRRGLPQGSLSTRASRKTASFVGACSRTAGVLTRLPSKRGKQLFLAGNGGGVRCACLFARVSSPVSTSTHLYTGSSVCSISTWLRERPAIGLRPFRRAGVARVRASTCTLVNEPP